ARRLEARGAIAGPCRRSGQPAEGKVAVALADLLDHGVGLALGEPCVPAEIRERMRKLGDAPAQPGDAEVLGEAMDSRIDEEGGFNSLDELDAGSAVTAR